MSSVQLSSTTGDGSVTFNSKTAEFYRDNIEFPFFLFHLKGKGDPKLPEAYMFETGRNEWRKHDQWPPKEAKPRTFYFQAGGKLAAVKPYRFGVRLRYDLMKAGPFNSRKDAEAAEKAVADALITRGHRVFWG